MKKILYILIALLFSINSFAEDNTVNIDKETQPSDKLEANSFKESKPKETTSKDTKKEDVIVVTGTLTRMKKEDVPVKTNIIKRDKIDNVKADSLADACNFTTGLRVENNCQNCNFTQLRINGLDGKYSSILLDGLPVFSSLAGVYMLEQIPDEMIERIEIVKGGGSALYAGDAVGGVVNIISRVPKENFVRVDYNSMFLGGNIPRFNLGSTIGRISEDQRMAGLVFGNIQSSEPYFENDDTFSEIGKMKNLSFGTKLFFFPDDGMKLTVDFHHLSEERRGGNSFDQPPHQADIAESISTKRYGGAITWKHKVNKGLNYKAYTSPAITHRDTYYGAEQDLNAYGQTDNQLWVSGLQFNFPFEMSGKHIFTAGLEHKYDAIEDKAVSYHRYIDETYDNFGVLLQEHYMMTKDFSLLGGIRLDKHSEIDNLIVSPRVSLLYKFMRELSGRATFSTGYKAPVVFDEDFHITQVGGESHVIVNSDDLKEEKSYSLTAGVEYTKFIEKSGFKFGINTFYTSLNDIHVLETEEIDVDNDGTIDQLRSTRINSDSAKVYGGEIEAGYVYSKYFQFDLGLTVQQSELSEAEPDFNTKDFFKTPNYYGYFVSTLKLNPAKLLVSGILTGPMKVPHFAGSIPEDRLETSKTFFELNVGIEYTFKLDKNDKEDGLTIFAGVKNVLNSFQDDFDEGIERDAGYVYGPRIPRTYYFGSKIKF